MANELSIQWINWHTRTRYTDQINTTASSSNNETATKRQVGHPLRLVTFNPSCKQPRDAYSTCGRMYKGVNPLAVSSCRRDNSCRRNHHHKNRYRQPMDWATRSPSKSSTLPTTVNALVQVPLSNHCLSARLRNRYGPASPCSSSRGA